MLAFVNEVVNLEIVDVECICVMNVFRVFLHEFLGMALGVLNVTIGDLFPDMLENAIDFFWIRGNGVGRFARLHSCWTCQV